MNKLTVNELIDVCEYFDKDLNEVWIEDGLVYVDGGHWDGMDIAPSVYTVKEIRDTLGLV